MLLVVPLGHILEHLVLGGYFCMAFKMVDDLVKQLVESVEVDAFGRWRPSEVEMRDWLLEATHTSFVVSSGVYSRRSLKP